MTPRSPNQQHHASKSTTSSRRLRNRADQDLSVQPPELPQVRGLRSRRAATLPVSRRISGNSYQPEETHTSPSVPIWDPSNLPDSFPRSNTSHPTGLEQNPPISLLSQPLDLPPFHSPQESHSELIHFSTSQNAEAYQAQHNSESNLLPSPLPSLSSSHSATDLELRLSVETGHPQDPSLDLQDMSTLGFMMPPAQYGVDHYGSPPSLDSPNYPSMSQQSYSESKSTTSGPYQSAYASSPGLHSQSQPRRSTDHPVLPPYPRSPYQQQPLGPMRGSPTPISYPPSSEPSPLLSSAPQSYSYQPVHSNVPSHTLGSNSSNYPPPPIYPPTTYAMGDYNHNPPALPTTVYPASSTATSYPSYEPLPSLAPPSAGSASLTSSPGALGNGVKVLNSRPKPQCWEHGCNGRQFSTFSNLLRHQREKSGTAAKSYCPRCGAEFTRTTARNGHMAHEKCKPRRTSDSSR